MAEDCFDGSEPENMDNCPNDLGAAGIAARVQYIPASFIETMTLPPKNGPMEATAKIASAGLSLKSEKGWKGIDVVIDENELKDMLVGGKANQKSQTKLTLMIAKLTPKVLGFKRRFANVPLVLNIPDSEGNNWLVGTKYSPAMIESAESTTGKAFEDRAGTVFELKANTGIYLYEGDVVETADTAD